MTTAQFTAMTRAQAERFMPDAQKQAARRRLSELVRDRTVLEIGCGRAEEIGDLFRPEKYVGVDCSAELVALCRARWPGYVFETCAGQDVPEWCAIDGTTFECGMIKAVLEHVPAAEAVEIYEAARSVVGTLYVCWHWEPSDRPKRTIYQGELGDMQQNRHQRSIFHGVTSREVVDRHVIWTVRGAL